MSVALDRPRGMDIQSLVERAVDGKADVGTLERLLVLAQTVRAEQARDSWNRAMAQFQRTCPPILRTKKARVMTKNGGTYEYSYAPLDEIVSTIRPALTEPGLSVTFRVAVRDNTVTATCRVSHEDGHSEESEFMVPVDTEAKINAAQQVAVASTYARRYALLAALGLAPEDDTDAENLESPQKPTSRISVEPQGEAIPKAGSVTTTIDKITQATGQTGTVRYTIHCGDGEYKFYTFSRTEAETAKAHAGTGELVQVEYKQTRYGFDLVSMAPPEAP